MVEKTKEKMGFLFCVFFFLFDWGGFAFFSLGLKQKGKKSLTKKGPQDKKKKVPPLFKRARGNLRVTVET